MIPGSFRNQASYIRRLAPEVSTPTTIRVRVLVYRVPGFGVPSRIDGKGLSSFDSAFVQNRQADVGIIANLPKHDTCQHRIQGEDGVRFGVLPVLRYRSRLIA